MSFNKFHTVRCAINTKSCKANCTCGATEKWRGKKIIELRSELARANKQTKHIKGGAENNIYNLLNAITDNKYGPYSVSRKDDVVPQWFDALAKETKVLIAELATAKTENEDLCDNVDAARQDLADYLNGTLEGKLWAENKRLQDEIRAKRQWQMCPRCHKGFRTDS